MEYTIKCKTALIWEKLWDKWKLDTTFSVGNHLYMTAGKEKKNDFFKLIFNTNIGGSILSFFLYKFSSNWTGIKIEW